MYIINLIFYFRFDMSLSLSTFIHFSLSRLTQLLTVTCFAHGHFPMSD